MKAFVINLVKNKQRLAKISSRLKMLGVDYELIVAVDGLTLSDTEKRSVCSYFRWKCVKGYTPRAGEIGCALSHQSAYKKIVDMKLPSALILEDDTVFDDRFVEQVRRIETWIGNEEPRVVLLSNYSKESCDAWEIRPTSGDSSAEAYVVNSKAAKSLYEHNRPFMCPFDYWQNAVRRKWVKLFHAFPTVIIPEWKTDPSYVSDVTLRSDKESGLLTDVSKMSIVGKVVWKIKRAIGLLIARFFF